MTGTFTFQASEKQFQNTCFVLFLLLLWKVIKSLKNWWWSTSLIMTHCSPLISYFYRLKVSVSKLVSALCLLGVKSIPKFCSTSSRHIDSTLLLTGEGPAPLHQRPGLMGPNFFSCNEALLTAVNAEWCHLTSFHSRLDFMEMSWTAFTLCL